MQNDDVIDELKNEIAILKSDLAKLNGMCKSESENTTDHIKDIYNYLKMLDDRSVADLNLTAETMTILRDAISPIEEKVFPGVAKAREQLAAIAAKRDFVAQEKNKKGS
jgi:hypothetical protein